MMRHAVDILMKRLALDETSQDLLEYALLVSLIALVAVAAVTTVGVNIRDTFWTYISGVMGAL